MLRLLFWLVVLGGVIWVLGTDMPIPGVAQQEVVYETPPPAASCGPSGCLAVYTLEIGNVGRSAQETVRVRMRADALETPAVAPTVRHAGGSTLVTPTEDRPGVMTLSLGQIGPDEHASLVFALRAPSRDGIPGWDRLLVGVDPATGAARPGDVGALTAGRIVNAAGRIATWIVGAVRKLVAS